MTFPLTVFENTAEISHLIHTSKIFLCVRFLCISKTSSIKDNFGHMTDFVVYNRSLVSCEKQGYPSATGIDTDHSAYSVKTELDHCIPKGHATP